MLYFIEIQQIEAKMFSCFNLLISVLFVCYHNCSTKANHLMYMLSSVFTNIIHFMMLN